MVVHQLLRGETTWEGAWGPACAHSVLLKGRPGVPGQTAQHGLALRAGAQSSSSASASWLLPFQPTAEFSLSACLTPSGYFVLLILRLGGRVHSLSRAALIRSS